MKTKLRLLTALPAALGGTLATAEDERRPEPPPQVRRPDAPRSPDRPAPMIRPAAFLGLATSPVPPVLAAQLGLPEGFGLVVEEVMPDSPAGQAGVLRFDVLRLFNDQQLVDPGQLATLVRAQGRDADVTLTLLRKGQEQKLSMKIVERPMAGRIPAPGPTGEMREQLERLRDGVGDKARRLQEQARDFEKRLREYQERLRNWQDKPGAEMPKPPEFQPPVEQGDIRREVRPGGAAPGRRLESRSTTANAKVLMKDDSGEIEVTSTDGRRHLLAKNAKGETVFDGPIDTPEQIKALPEDLRKKVEAIKVRTKVETTAPLRPLQPATRREEQERGAPQL